MVINNERYLTVFDELKREKQDLEKLRKSLEGWAQVRRILEAQQWEEWPSGDIIIKIKRTALVGCENPGVIPPDICDVSTVPTEMEATKRSIRRPW